MTTTIDLEQCRQMLRFEPETGAFFWLHRADVKAAWNAKYAGTRAGTINKSGYRTISILKKLVYAHHLAWLFIHLHWPEALVDHENGDRDDNRPRNLRPANGMQNAANSKIRSTNKSGFKGVHWQASAGCWRCVIHYRGKKISLGYFHNKDEAARRYDKEARLLFGNYARTNFAEAA